MSALADRWSRWSEAFVALTRRERIVVGAALLLGGGFLAFNFGIDPLLIQARGASRAEAAARADLAAQQAHVAALTAQSADPDAQSRNRLAQARRELALVGERLARFESGMVPPARMQAFLEGLLARNRNLDVLGLKTLPVTLVGTPAPADRPDPARPARGAAGDAAVPAASEGIYQHGIEIRLAGNYNDLLNYLAELERMPQRVMWNSISLTVEKHPRNVLVLRVYTLSLDKNWLVV